MKVLSRRQILDVIVLFVRAADQIGAAFECLIDEQDRLARIRSCPSPNRCRAARGIRRENEQFANFVLLHGTRLFARQPPIESLASFIW